MVLAPSAELAATLRLLSQRVGFAARKAKGSLPEHHVVRLLAPLFEVLDDIGIELKAGGLKCAPNNVIREVSLLASLAGTKPQPPPPPLSALLKLAPPLPPLEELLALPIPDPPPHDQVNAMPRGLPLQAVSQVGECLFDDEDTHGVPVATFAPPMPPPPLPEDDAASQELLYTTPTHATVQLAICTFCKAMFPFPDASSRRNLAWCGLCYTQSNVETCVLDLNDFVFTLANDDMGKCSDGIDMTLVEKDMKNCSATNGQMFEVQVKVGRQSADCIISKFCGHLQAILSRTQLQHGLGKLALAVIKSVGLPVFSQWVDFSNVVSSFTMRKYSYTPLPEPFQMMRVTTSDAKLLWRVFELPAASCLYYVSIEMLPTFEHVSKMYKAFEQLGHSQVKDILYVWCLLRVREFPEEYIRKLLGPRYILITFHTDTTTAAGDVTIDTIDDSSEVGEYSDAVGGAGSEQAECTYAGTELLTSSVDSFVTSNGSSSCADGTSVPHDCNQQ
jgi:hypothetical protein